MNGYEQVGVAQDENGRPIIVLRDQGMSEKAVQRAQADYRHAGRKTRTHGIEAIKVSQSLCIQLYQV